MEKRLIVVSAISILSIATSLPTQAGSFGLCMGMSIEQIDPKAKEIAPGKFLTTNVPKSHSSFEQYIVQIGKENGLCWIKAIDKNVQTSSYGIEIKSEFKSMNSKLSKVYGTSETTDLLLPGSIWNEPNDFMMALIKKRTVFIHHLG